ncbi:MAG TPA: hypothetical protein VE222_08940 [Nitrospiraceae bacterium]|nr:hypothetical protein [Nitrospiraceae bacterium]
MKMQFSFYTLALLAVMMAGCAIFGYEHKALLNETDYVAFLGNGTGMVSGEVSVTMRDGKITHGENSFIYLIPVTPYTSEWFQHAIQQDHKISGIDPRSFRVTRASMVGTEGRFQFTNVPAGEYYLTCTITPDLPPYRFLWVSISRAGTDAIKVYATVTVQVDDHVKVTVTRPPS